MGDIAIKETGMDLVQDMLPIVVSESPFPIDILDRQEVAKQLLDLLTTLSESQSSCTFAFKWEMGVWKNFSA